MRKFQLLAAMAVLAVCLLGFTACGDSAGSGDAAKDDPVKVTCENGVMMAAASVSRRL